MSTRDDVRDQAERIVLGAMMTNPAAVETVADMGLTSGDFYRAHHGVVYAYLTAAYAAGEPTEPVKLTERLLNAGQIRGELDAAFLHDCVRAVPLTAQVADYAQTVISAAHDRKVAEILDRGRQLAERDGRQAAEMVADALARVTSPPSAAEQSMIELDDLLDQDDPEYDWLIPGLLERGDRLILVGGEGYGKTTLLRQLAVQAASGLHPFGGDDYPPLRVLHVDVENGARHTRREYRRLRLAAGDRYKSSLFVAVRPQGLDLLDADEGRWLLAQARNARPDLLIVGPLYKLASGDPTDEQVARTVALWLDRLRTEMECALILEAHAPHAGGGQRRPERPYGASLWLRWPEFGLFLDREGALRHWRGQRDEREWPPALKRGGAWPWTPVDRARDALWARIVEVQREFNGQLSMRAVATRLGSNLPAVQRAVAEHRDEWKALTSPQVGGGDTP